MVVPARASLHERNTGSANPQLCIDASQSQSANTPVILRACGSDSFEEWMILGGTGTGQIESTAGAGGPESCLTAVGTNQGDPVSMRCRVVGLNADLSALGRVPSLHERCEPAVDHQCCLEVLVLVSVDRSVIYMYL